jgi:hypothetical protein
MAWISAVLAWFVLTVMRNRRDLFAFGALVAGFSAIFAINAINPDAIIARTNIERAEHGRELDVYYLTTLSADAVPLLVESFPEIGDRRIEDEWLGKNHSLRETIVDRWNVKHSDWRTWNLSRSRAHWLVRTYAEDQATGTSETGRR